MRIIGAGWIRVGLGDRESGSRDSSSWALEWRRQTCLSICIRAIDMITVSCIQRRRWGQCGSLVTGQEINIGTNDAKTKRVDTVTYRLPTKTPSKKIHKPN